MQCNTCGKDYPYTNEYFTEDKRAKCGLTTRCKTCTKAYMKAYYNSNKEEARQQQRERYKNNKEHILAQTKEYARRNKEAVAARKHKYYKEHFDEIAQKSKAYRESHKEYQSTYHKQYRIKHYNKLVAYHKEYRETNKDVLSEQKRLDRIQNPQRYREYESRRDKEQRREKNKRYRISLKGKAVHNISNIKRRTLKRCLPSDFTKTDWEDCVKYFNGRCAYCGEEAELLSQDHFIPLAKMGEFTKNNVICCCVTCNSSKQDFDFFEWYPKQSFYSKKRERKILEYLNYDTKTKYQQLAL